MSTGIEVQHGGDERTERLRQTRTRLEGACAEDSADAATLEKLGIVCFQLGDGAAAVEYLRQAVAANSRSGSAWNNLAVTLEAAARFAEAEECYRRAIELAPRLALPHFNRGNTLRALGQFLEAEASFRRCLQMAPDHVEARHNLAALLKGRGARAEAEILFREVLAVAPDFVDAHVNLGSTLQALGRDEEALACYREALRLAPGYPDAAAGEAGALDRLGLVEEARERARAAMAAAPDNPDAITIFANFAPALRAEEQALSALEGLLETPALALEKREAALFARGKLLDRAGRYEEAFAAYQAAHACRPRSFDTAGFRASAEHVRDFFSREMLARLPRAQSTELPVFVVGMPRSGTSLVEQILASHPAVHGAGELTWVDDFSHSLSQRLGSRAEYPECLRDVSVRALDAAAEEYLALVRRDAPGAVRVIDKMPGNFLHLGLVELLFPGARIIHIRRDPLDTCLSCYFQNFTQGHEYTRDLGTLGIAYREYERLMAHWRVTLRSPVLELRYEQLVEQQESESRRLLDFCGLPWDDRCLRFHETRRRVRTASYEQVRRPMYRDSVARSRHYEQFLEPLRAALEQA